VLERAAEAVDFSAEDCVEFLAMRCCHQAVQLRAGVLGATDAVVYEFAGDRPAAAGDILAELA
jgi:hypothetical protein